MNLKLLISVALLSFGLAGCAGMTPEEKCTIGGAAVGGLAGSVLTDQSALGTVGGAAVGGVVGREVGKRGRCP